VLVGQDQAELIRAFGAKCRKELSHGRMVISI
jgi:hypothetical protein